MAIWETEDESTGPANRSLPTPADTPYRTASRESRRSRHSGTPPGQRHASPIPSDKGSKRSSRDVTNDESISPLDPRRFTPTLHANLISEILALRRDQEDKIKFIEGLEASLHASKAESENLQKTLLSTGKESRSLKRQLALLEGGTSSALSELARERDEAVDTTAESKRRLEVAQKKVRNLEEASTRVHDQWAKEKESWEEERRKHERKVHVTESRLKVLLDEVAAYEAERVNGAHHALDAEGEESSKDNDAASIRTMSITNSLRFSMVNGSGKPTGFSLADELNFDGDDGDDSDHGGRESVMSDHNRTYSMSRDSFNPKTHMRKKSFESPQKLNGGRGRFGLHHSTFDRFDGGVIKENDETQGPTRHCSYTDSAVQYSPPPSPKHVPARRNTPEPPISSLALERGHDTQSPPRSDVEVEANQRRKRVSVVRPLSIEYSSPTNLMVNGSCQTAGEPLSPPKTPTTPFYEASQFKLEKAATSATMVSSATQTDSPPPLQQYAFLGFPPTLPIPSISVIPPTSRPTTPREPRLPPLSKNFGCQVTILSSAPTKSVAVQTEEIRIDKRLAKLPIHLHPASITSRPTSPAPTKDSQVEESRHFTPLPGNVPPRNPRRLNSNRSFTSDTPSPSLPPPAPGIILNAYPGGNDDGALSNLTAPTRRPPRVSSLFAGFDMASSDEVDEFGDVDLTDGEYSTALSAPRPPAGPIRPRSKRGSTTIPTSSPDAPLASKLGNGKSFARTVGGTELYSSFTLPESRQPRESMVARPVSKLVTRSSAPNVSHRTGVNRKSVMIQGAITNHQRSRSPTLQDSRDPPFPIPTRASSRRPPVSVSAPSDGRRSPESRGSGSWKSRRGSRSQYRASSIRKVKSAATVAPNDRRGPRSRSPPLGRRSDSPGHPPLPDTDISMYRTQETGSKYKTHRSQPSTNTAITADSGMGSVGSGSQASGVVDAIAQTMVGEWMLKYVRRRKSFGVGENKGDDSSNDRHKRWVWLAPYERSILWSSKQPVSGSALMGKAGRKLTIQSVLDVKDDNPPPKGVGPMFNRSILILTPERALKFTAVNAERHYIWLTALSFLAHSQQAVPEIVAPSLGPIVEDITLPRAKLRKPAIRDSIRVAKDKAAVPNTPVPLGTVSSQSDRAPSSNFSPPLPDIYSNGHTHQREHSAAEPPFVPRFGGQGPMMHGRKRSNTAGHVPPPLSFRGFSGPAYSQHASTNSTAGTSVAGSSSVGGSSESYSYSHSGASNMTTSWGMLSNTGGSVRTSQASTGTGNFNNFFDAIGTVRMEAFISPHAFSRIDDDRENGGQASAAYRQARRRSKEMRRMASRSRQRDSYMSRGTRGTDEVEEWYSREDPFNEF